MQNAYNRIPVSPVTHMDLEEEDDFQYSDLKCSLSLRHHHQFEYKRKFKRKLLAFCQNFLLFCFVNFISTCLNPSSVTQGGISDSGIPPSLPTLPPSTNIASLELPFCRRSFLSDRREWNGKKFIIRQWGCTDCESSFNYTMKVLFSHHSLRMYRNSEELNLEPQKIKHRTL